MFNNLLKLMKTRGKMFMLAAAGLFASSVSAQMSGTSYTINSGAAASSTNFQDWTSFTNSLQGIATRPDGGTTYSSAFNGAVTCTVVSSLTVNSSITLPNISTSSSTNQVKIVASVPGTTSVTLSSAATDQAVIRLTGMDWLTIDGLKIINARASANSFCIHMNGGSDNNTVKNSSLEFSGMVTSTTSTASSGAYCAFSASLTDLSAGGATGTNGSNFMFANNTCKTTAASANGPTFGIYDVQNSGTYSGTGFNNTYRANKISNFFVYGIYTYYNNGIRINNNDVSRSDAATSANTPSSSMYAIYSYYTYASTRSITYDSNYIHDMPYFNASVSAPGSVQSVYCLQNWYSYGSSTYRTSVKNNRVNAVKANYAFFGILGQYVSYCDYNKNIVESCESNTGGYNFYAMGAALSTACTTIGNTIRNNKPNTYCYMIFHTGNSTSDNNVVQDNIITDNVTQNTNYYHQNYGIYLVNGTCDVQRNLINNYAQSGYGGYVYAVYAPNAYNSIFASNVLWNIQGYYGSYCMYVYTSTGNCRIQQNTILGSQTSAYAYGYTYGIMFYTYNSTADNYLIGNIMLSNSYGAYLLYNFGNGNTMAACNYNTWYSTSSFWYWYYQSSFASSWAGYYTSGVGADEVWENPRFVNPAINDFRPTAFRTQNCVPTFAAAPKDVTGANRATISSDRGAQERFCDIQAMSAIYNGGSPICSNTSYNLGIRVKNLYIDTAYNFNVSYSINGGPKTTAKVTKKLLMAAPNDSTTLYFAAPVKFNQPGTKKLRIFVDMPDDNRANDTITYTIVVKPTASGSSITNAAVATKALYFPTKANDVTILNESVHYDVSNPTYPLNYDHTTYGTNWTVSVYAKTPSGLTITGADVPTWTAPTSSAVGRLKWTPTTRLYEDSIITLWAKITNNITGCDTFVSRKVLQYGKIIPSFKFPTKICDGDAVLFSSNSYVKSGAIDYMWYFGTANNDSSNAPSPVFVFPGPGTYNVKMVGKTLPYGFQSDTTITVTVNSIPKVGFTKTNACEGKSLTFTNTTTPVNSAYSWDMGDGSALKTTKDVTYMYTTTGSYLVTLSASLNGCTAKQTQRVYQFDKPKASFTVTGNCDNLPFNFNNTTTIKSGLVGHYWNFNDNGQVSTDDDPMHLFTPVTAVTTKRVLLTATSEFGCVDTVGKTVTILPSPRVSFSFDKACSLSPTQFTNTTPTVTGATPSYSWDFGDGGTSVQANPSKTWSSLGMRTVTLKVNLSNGCKSESMKQLEVLVQPKAQYVAADACANKPVVFDNQSTWESGDISYSWDFAGFNPTTTASDPVITFASVTNTTTINVKLTATIAGGCSDEITKQITINELPKTCDFNSKQDYSTNLKGLRFSPKTAAGVEGGASGVEYTWIIENEGGGKTTGVGTAADFIKVLQNPGNYKVTMRAKVLATGCDCEKTQTVTVSSTNNIVKVGFSVSPNPSKGNFQLLITDKFGKDVKVEVLNAVGAVVKTVNATVGINNIDANELAAGVYVLRVSGANVSSSQQIVIQK